MAAFNKLYSFVLANDTLKVMLTNTAPIVTNTVPGDIAEIAAGNGYAAGGITAAVTSAAVAAGIFKVVVADVVFTATGAVGPFRYAVLYNVTASRLIGWYDYGSAVTLASGETFTVDFDATSGVLTLT